MSPVRALLDRFMGYGDSAVTVPVLDGPLLPNRRLDDAEQVGQIEEIDNLIVMRAKVFCSSGNKILSVDLDATVPAMETFKAFDSPISALHNHADAVAVGLDGSGVQIEGGRYHGLRINTLNDRGFSQVLSAPTSVLWLDENTLVVANGADGRRSSEWRRDLMHLGNTGTVWRIDLNTRVARALARDLQWPTGLGLAPDGCIYLGESWRHRILSLSLDARAEPKVALGDLPAYPARISRSREGGYWLSFYSIRNQLVEFILREKQYRQRMLKEVAEPYWIAPTLQSGLSFLEPMQQNELRQMGIMKPWAPTRSYGLVAHCDKQMQPTHSYHSRADGVMHGAVSVCEHVKGVLVAARGPGKLLRVADQSRQEA